MAGYVRQSAADIITGEVILAASLNNEYNALQAAFHATTGHPHDGTTGNGPKLALTTAVSGVLPVANGGFAGIHKVNGTTAPTVNDDSGDGYAVGSHWIDTTADDVYILSDSTLGAAVWQNMLDADDIGVSVQAYDAGLAALASFNTNGILVQSANNTFVGRTLTGTSQEITVTNGDGVSGNPTLSLPTTLNFSGKTLINSTIASPTITGSSGTASGATWVNLGTVTTVDVNGGTIDGTVIGGASAAAGTFTTLLSTNYNGIIGNATPAAGTFTTLTGTSFNGIVGNVTPAAGTFTTVDINGGTVDGTVLATSKIRADTEITDTADTSKEIQFVVSDISASTTRTVTMPDRNIIVQKHTRQVFTSGTSWTKPTGCTYIQVEAVGGGGGGGGVDGQGAGTGVGASGGASGAYGITELINVTGISSATIAIGALGAGGTAGANSGTTGGNTTFNDGTTTYTWGGGGGGTGLNAAATATLMRPPLAVPGTGTNVVAYGRRAYPSYQSSDRGVSGYGADSEWGYGGDGSTQTASGGQAGGNAVGYGAGGGGAAVVIQTSNYQGGDGAPGRMVVWEYYT